MVLEVRAADTPTVLAVINVTLCIRSVCIYMYICIVVYMYIYIVYNMLEFHGSK